MSATETATERAAIEQIVQLYIDGVSKGDGEKLRQAFHESAWMYGSLAGTRYDEPISELITLVTVSLSTATGATTRGSRLSYR